MTEEIKQKYLEIINTIEGSESVLSSLMEFINSYDGTNSAEAHALIQEVIAAAIQMIEISAKAEAYEKLESQREERSEILQELAEQVTEENSVVVVE